MDSNQINNAIKSYEQTKKPRSLDELVDLLLSRGLISTQENLKTTLSRISYFRLSGYWYHFRRKDQETGAILDEFCEGTTLNDILRVYEFDQELSLLCFNVVKQIEVNLRCFFVQETTTRLGAFFYANSDDPLFHNWDNHSVTIKALEKRAMFKQNAQNSSKESYVTHMEEKYSDEHMPLWMAAELMDFGTLIHFMEQMDATFWNALAQKLSLPIALIKKWMYAIRNLRNVCAHHARIWNKSWGTRSLPPNRSSDMAWYASLNSTQWTFPRIGTPKRDLHLALDNDRTGMLLFICQYILTKLGMDRSWALQIEKLFSDYQITDLELKSMGLPPHCFEHPVWCMFH